MQQGCRLVIDEIDRGSMDALTALLAIAQDRDLAGIQLPDGTRIKPHPDFHIVATSNIESPAELIPALASRFSLAINIQHPHPAAIARLPEDMQPIAAKLCSADIEASRRMTLRAFLSYSEAVEAGVPTDTAAFAAFGTAAQAILDAAACGEIR